MSPDEWILFAGSVAFVLFLFVAFSGRKPIPPEPTHDYECPNCKWRLAVQAEEDGYPDTLECLNCGNLFSKRLECPQCGGSDCGHEL